MLHEVLKFEVGGTTWNFDSVTIHRGAVRPSGALREVRHAALDTLRDLFRASDNDQVRRTIKHAFNDATRPPSDSGVDANLIEVLLGDAIRIVSVYREFADRMSFALLQSVEHDLFWLHRHRGKPRADFQNKTSIVALHGELARAIIAFRDQVNADRRFVIYKTLVGFESVFLPMWDGETDVERNADYRRKRIGEFVTDVTAENSAEWFDIIALCARTKSNDAATFPSFGSFLEELGQRKPDLVLKLIAKLDDDLARFLPWLLKGLEIGERLDAVTSLVGAWLIERKYLREIVIYCSIAPTFDAGLLERAIGGAISNSDSIAVVWAMEAAARQNKSPEELVERVFLPGLRYLASMRDTRWVGAVWPFTRKSAIFSSLSEAGVEEVLTSLVPEIKLAHEAEWVLAVIAKEWPVRVIDYFIDRLRLANTDDAPKGYEPVPFSLSELEDPLASFAADMVRKLREWHDDDARLFQYRGAQFLKAIFPKFTPLGASLRSIVAQGERRGLEFVLAVLRVFDGRKVLQPICRDIVATLQPGDELLTEVEVVLDTTGMVSGQFGFVEAYLGKKAEIQDWLTDPREQVRVFAERHMRSLDRAIAAEQRRGMERHELRKREYENLAENQIAAGTTVDD